MTTTVTAVVDYMPLVVRCGRQCVMHANNVGWFRCQAAGIPFTLCVVRRATAANNLGAWISWHCVGLAVTAVEPCTIFNYHACGC